MSNEPAAQRKWRRRAVLAAIGAVWIVAAIAGAVVGVFEAFGPPPLGRDLEMSKVVLDRHGKLLRAYLTSEGRWRLPATRQEVDPRFLEALLAYEDKRFFVHHGVDPLAMMRAAYQLVTHGRIVSGGSTLTMQVARLLEPRQKRSVDAKIRQTVRAIELEWALSKDEILGLYLTLAPYGGNLEGLRAASLAYFGKEPRRLTLGEAALLVALPQSPEYRRPDRYPGAAKRARNRVLDRIARPHLVQRRRDCRRQGREGADRAQADAAVGAARRRPGGDGVAGRVGAAADHQCADCKRRLRDSPATGRRCWGPTYRWRWWWSTMPAGRCSHASAPPIISTSAARARSI